MFSPLLPCHCVVHGQRRVRRRERHVEEERLASLLLNRSMNRTARSPSAGRIGSSVQSCKRRPLEAGLVVPQQPRRQELGRNPDRAIVLDEADRAASWARRCRSSGRTRERSGRRRSAGRRPAARRRDARSVATASGLAFGTRNGLLVRADRPVPAEMPFADTGGAVAALFAAVPPGSAGPAAISGAPHLPTMPDCNRVRQWYRPVSSV